MEKSDSMPMLGGLRRMSKARRKYSLTEDTTCGIGCLKGSFLQRFANQKAYVFLYGILGLTLSAAYSYFNGTLSTIEKRFQIPSRTTGLISVGNDMTTLVFGAALTYFASKGHRPRWIAVGLYTVVTFCLLNALPHFLYGPGEDAVSLTMEYGGASDTHSNKTLDILEKNNKKTLCMNRTLEDIAPKKDELGLGSFGAPALILLASQCISGIGGCLYFTLGVAYMDDNTKKDDAPVLVSISHTIRMLGPAFGYSLSSLCLKYYIAPTLTPKITNSDPRWLGAWWIGWLLLAAVLFIAASLIGLFPHTLPKAHYRRQESKLSKKSNKSEDDEDEEDDTPASMKDMYITFKRLCQNKPYMFTNGANVFFFFGYMPYWIFMAKYIEVIYKTSSSKASLVTGSIGLLFSGIGILAGGSVITKFKPSARYLAGWNMFVAVVAGLGLLAYTLVGCPQTNDPKGFEVNGTINYIGECNAACNCDFVKYSPVCAYGESFISPCHAGCTNFQSFPDGSKIFTDCSCVNATGPDGTSLPPVAKAGPCEASCNKQFYMFLCILCFLKFCGATARTSNFLISLRCVKEKDKPASMGFGATVASLFAFIPSPIFFGYLMDTQCLVWGKTSSGQGNCWLYDADSLKYVLNTTASVFVFIGALFDFGVWYFVKGIPIFDKPEVDDGKSTDDKEGKELEIIPNGKPSEKESDALIENGVNQEDTDHTADNSLKNVITK